MERDAVKKKNNNYYHHREDGVVCRSPPETTTSATTTDLVLQWGNRKRLRCMKIQAVKDDSTTVRSDRRVVRVAEKDFSSTITTAGATTNNINFRRPLSSPPPPPPPPLPPPHRILRNSETSFSMKGQSNGVRRSFSPEGGDERAHDKKTTTTTITTTITAPTNGKKKPNNDNNNVINGTTESSETAHDSKKGGGSGGGSSSGSEVIPVWLPKFVIALTNKEKEEDFMAIKGSKLPQRPKKRAKIIQRTLNLVSPGSWLCDLTLERYEVREKKICKKRPRGLKAMGNVDSDSE